MHSCNYCVVKTSGDGTELGDGGDGGKVAAIVAAGRPPSDEVPAEKRDEALLYGLEDRPPILLCIVLGFQHYLLAFGGIIAIPLILAEPLCAGGDDLVKGLLINTMFFASGLATLLQTTLGTRLPILQGGSLSFVAPAFAILALPEWRCPALNGTEAAHGAARPSDPEVWQPRMRELQGAIMVASLFQVALGLTGAMGPALRLIGPLSIAPTITLIGLSLFGEAGRKSGGHWGIACLTVALIVLFSQYLRDVAVPVPGFVGGRCRVVRYPVFKMFSVLLAMCISWLLCYILTLTDSLPAEPGAPGHLARTDLHLQAIQHAPWFRVPYPGQWGAPTLGAASALGMLCGVVASALESVGDYAACARLAGAPPPPAHAVSRGLAVEGLGCLLAGSLGTGNGTTSFSQNIAALGITRVGSRLVLQVSGVILVLMGVFGKCGAVFITIPDPIIGGMFLGTFGMIAAVGISTLQYADMNSSRNVFIVGLSIFSGLSIPAWLKENPGAINTGVAPIDQTLTVLCTMSMFVGGFLGFVLDNTVPGTVEERGLLAWRSHGRGDPHGTQDGAAMRVYDLPLVAPLLRKWTWPRRVPVCPTFGQRPAGAPVAVGTNCAV
ncbi:solute carrier family 23 member 1-like isoform X4 [Lethenteron reissneri]|uniref:solute carrier family 23 member 1-like isoform X4 n=1 Tax=Lethenteron reissneri TaxID=7753 RepID=UPI002AB7E0F3|nr:solute carrier family 23 member 1-like isoform X4 [Lethenteron reissneri]